MAVMYKATKSFSGLINMKKGDVKEIKNEEIANETIDALHSGKLSADDILPKRKS